MFERPGSSPGLMDPDLKNPGSKNKGSQNKGLQNESNDGGSLERAVLVHLHLVNNTDGENLEEFRELALSAGAQPVAEISCSRRTLDPKYLIGSGKAEEVRLLVEREKADLVLVDHALAPSQ
ncbi:HflX-like GTP-binding protein, partial [Kaarinaea lacus]